MDVSDATQRLISDLLDSRTKSAFCVRAMAREHDTTTAEVSRWLTRINCGLSLPDVKPEIRYRWRIEREILLCWALRKTVEGKTANSIAEDHGVSRCTVMALDPTTWCEAHHCTGVARENTLSREQQVSLVADSLVWQAQWGLIRQYTHEAIAERYGVPVSFVKNCADKLRPPAIPKAKTPEPDRITNLVHEFCTRTLPGEGG